MTDQQALAWIATVLRRSAWRIDRDDRKRAAIELLILDAAPASGDTRNRGASWVAQVADGSPPLDEQAEAHVDLGLLVRVLPPRHAKLALLFASGFTVTEAARRLGVAARTVERDRVHIAEVMLRLGWPHS